MNNGPQNYNFIVTMADGSLKTVTAPGFQVGSEGALVFCALVIVQATGQPMFENLRAFPAGSWKDCVRSSLASALQ
jgi:hypothetical protein